MDYFQQLQVNLMEKMFKAWNIFKDLKIHEKIYTCTATVYLIGFFAVGFHAPFFKLFQLTINVGLIAFVAGFLIEFRPLLIRLWKSTIGFIAISIFHLFILLASNAWARLVVTKSLGLPAQDFDLTVHFITLLFYVPVWIFVVASLLTVAVFIFAFYWFFGMILRGSFLRSMIQMSRVLGAIGLLWAATYMFDFLAARQAKLDLLVKWSAYVCDYQEAFNYPGVQKGERIRLHENGVISVATQKAGAIKISLRNFEQTADTKK